MTTRIMKGCPEATAQKNCTMTSPLLVNLWIRFSMRSRTWLRRDLLLDDKQCIHHGVDRLIPKPLGMSTLMEALHDVGKPARYQRVSAYSAVISNPRSARSMTVQRRACGKRATLWITKATAPDAVFVSPGRNDDPPLTGPDSIQAP